MTVINMEFFKRLQCFDKSRLSLAPAFCERDNAGEILSFGQGLMWFENSLRQGLKIKPVSPFPLFLTQTVV